MTRQGPDDDLRRKLDVYEVDLRRPGEPFHLDRYPNRAHYHVGHAVPTFVRKSAQPRLAARWLGGQVCGTDFGRIVARTAASTSLAPDDSVTVRPNGKVHLFDPTTGVRIG